ncbi:MAG: SGNH/GDSL hydrolase family protein [Acidobacteriota bacterium]|nr:SGNH/GDSL hydrolase family protein [Acidobacteriota bacterium]
MNSLKSAWFLALLLVPLLFSCKPSSNGLIILCAGDSITESIYPSYLQKALKHEGIKARVLNYGISGNTSGEYLNFLNKNKEALSNKHPDFILLQLGTNDVRIDHDKTESPQFYINMKNIISIFKTFKTRSGKESKILLATVPPIPENVSFPFNKNSASRVTEEINPLIKKICMEENIGFVDNHALFADSPELLPEVHPSREGYRELSLNWMRALKTFLAQ